MRPQRWATGETGAEEEAGRGQGISGKGTPYQHTRAASQKPTAPLQVAPRSIPAMQSLLHIPAGSQSPTPDPRLNIRELLVPGVPTSLIPPSAPHLLEAVVVEGGKARRGGVLGVLWGPPCCGRDQGPGPG